MIVYVQYLERRPTFVVSEKTYFAAFTWDDRQQILYRIESESNDAGLYIIVEALVRPNIR